MKTLQDKIVKWHYVTFPNASIRAIEEKLIEELEELDHAITVTGNKKEIIEEIADVVIVACSWLARYGLDFEQTVLHKLEINKGREWGKETENGDRPREK